MAVLTWDQVGERTYQTGLDRGVLYLSDGTAVPWNGLTAVEELFNRETRAHYLDGIKFLEYSILGEFSGKLKAITYPDEFGEIQGVETAAPGFFVHDQRPTTFGLSYRTRIGNDLDGTDRGYTVHVLWNLRASPDTITHVSMSDQSNPIEFSWTLTARPEAIDDRRATAHLSFRSTDIDPEVLFALEERLYGTSTANPSLPTPQEMIDIALSVGSLSIVDNGDGTWTASGEPVTVLDGSAQITNIQAVFLDPGTYQIETTDPLMLSVVDNGDGTWSATGPNANFTMPTEDTFQITGIDTVQLDADTYQISSTILE